MKSSQNSAIRIVYYDGTGRHETKPCNNLHLLCVNYSVHTLSEPTLTFSLWFGDGETGHDETITIPFTHTIEPVPNDEAEV